MGCPSTVELQVSRFAALISFADVVSPRRCSRAPKLLRDLGGSVRRSTCLHACSLDARCFHCLVTAMRIPARAKLPRENGGPFAFTSSAGSRSGRASP